MSPEADLFFLLLPFIFKHSLRERERENVFSNKMAFFSDL
jgi:hypothetical protein